MNPASANGLVVVAVVCAACPWVGAEPVVPLEDVEVLARPVRAVDAIDPYGARVSTVGPAQLRGLNARDLAMAVRRIPGVSISRFNAVGAFGGADGGAIYLRGLGASRLGSEITLYMDGAPRETGVWAHPLLDVTPVDFAGDIAVRKGPHPVAHPGTFGAVDLQGLRREAAGYGGFAAWALGAYATRMAGLGAGARADRTDAYAGWSLKTSDGHRPRSAARLQSWYARLGHECAEGFEASWRMYYTDNGSEDPGRDDRPAPLRERFDTESLTQVLRLDVDREDLNGFLAGYFEEGQIRWARDRIGGPGTPPGSADTDWRNYGLRSILNLRRGDWVVSPALDARWEGGDFSNRTLSGFVPFEYDARYRTLAPGLFLRLEPWVGTTHLQASAGARYLDHSRFGGEWSPLLGVRLGRQTWSLGAQYVRGVNFPGVYAEGVSAASLDRLEAEILNHWELSTDWHAVSRRLQVTATVFRDEGDNRLLRTPDGLVNAGTFEHTGLEMVVSASPFDTVSVYVGSAWISNP